MAVFLINTCKFNGCGLTFATLSTLIQHIEETHLDTDPEILEQQETEQPPSLAPSYVFRVFTDGSSKEKRHRLSSLSPVSSLRSTTPTGSEFDDEDGRSSEDDSDDSWTTQEEFTSELILSMMTNSNKDSSADKPFACPVPGCKKRYKNINGIKYHAKHGHKKEVRVRKPYKCKCGKNYKTTNALQSHSLLQHQGSLPNLLSVKARPTSKSRSLKQTSVPKAKTTALVGKLPGTALASQTQARKQLQASLKHLASNINSVPQTLLAAPAKPGPATHPGNPATALVTVPVTFGKFPTVHDKEVSYPHQQMLNLIAPSGLVPPGTTITVPMEQIARNLALLQQVSKHSAAATASSPALLSTGYSPATKHVIQVRDPLPSTAPSSRLIDNIPEIAVPNCMLTHDHAPPFSFTDASFDNTALEEEMASVEVSLDKSHDADEQLSVMSLDSGSFSQPCKDQDLCDVTDSIVDDSGIGLDADTPTVAMTMADIEISS